MASYPVSGKIAMVTGAARGIGFGTAQELTKRGATVVVVDLDQAAADEAAERLGPEAMGLACDVTDAGSLQHRGGDNGRALRPPDVVVANAGIASGRPPCARCRARRRARAGREPDGGLAHRERRSARDRAQQGPRRGDRVGVRVPQRRRRHALRHGQGRGRTAGPRAAGRAPSTGPGRAWPTSASSTPRWCTRGSTRIRWRTRSGSTPRVLQKRLQPSQAGKGIVDGIEKRAPRIIRPHRWVAFSLLRGLINPLLDSAMVRDEDTQSLAAEMDKRGDQEQPTTA